MFLRAAYFLCAVAAMAFAQAESDVVFRQSFDGGTGTWTAMGERAKVSSATGSHGLVFSYELAPKVFSGVVTPPPADLSKMQRIRFRVKTDHATGMALLLSEKKPGGGNYSAWFWSPANTWQWIEFTPADFTVNDGPNDPKDSDGKLDLADVDGIGLFDLGQFFASLPGNTEMPVTVRLDQGAHTATVESFEVLSTPAGAAPLPANGLRMGMLDRNFVDWVTLGGMDLKLSATRNPLSGPAMEASYQQAEGQFQLLVRRIAGVEMAKAKRLTFDIASEHEVTLMLSLEMSKAEGGQGRRFTLPLFPPGGKEVFHVDLDLADFKGDGAFDPAQWRTFAIVDISVASGGVPEANTLWLGNFAALK
jgi:hypothetical protein